MTTQQDVERQFYSRALAENLRGSASTGYGMPVNQQMRFDLWYDQVGRKAEPGFSLLDVGSGTGDLVDQMDRWGLGCREYLGVDIMEEMTDRARELYVGHDQEQHGRVRFETADVAQSLTWPSGWYPRDMKFDHVVSIAAYALKAPHDSQAESITQVQRAIEQMTQMARKTVFVTLFSTWKTNIIPEEMVLDPVTMFAWAKSKWERVDLFHGYAPFDFTLLIGMDKSEWRLEWERQQ